MASCSSLSSGWLNRLWPSATIAVDVKRFCNQIKADEVFGTHSQPRQPGPCLTLIQARPMQFKLRSLIFKGQ
jgi:hypothetical protein